MQDAFGESESHAGLARGEECVASKNAVVAGRARTRMPECENSHRQGILRTRGWTWKDISGLTVYGGKRLTTS